jgi:hypothetical protein
MTTPTTRWMMLSLIQAIATDPPDCDTTVNIIHPAGTVDMVDAAAVGYDLADALADGWEPLGSYDFQRDDGASCTAFHFKKPAPPGWDFAAGIPPDALNWTRHAWG